MPSPNFNKRGSPLSAVDLFSGKHTRLIIVAFLVLVLLGIIAFCNLEEKTSAALLNVLLLLVGFLTGSETSKRS
jgi:hypothetical protein